MTRPLGGIACVPRHEEAVSRSTAIGFGLAASSAFVASLYVLVPPRVRRLPRNDKRQIQWRAVASGIVCLGTAIAYPYLICSSSSSDGDPNSSSTDTPTRTTNTSVKDLSLYDTLLWNVRACGYVMTHVSILYLGPLVQSMTEVYVHLKRTKRLGVVSFLQTCYQAYLQPLARTFRSSSSSPIHDNPQWIQLRNLVIAPVTEEFVFRGFLVPALMATDLSVRSVCWLAPVFFGIAHAHHAIRRIVQEKEGIPKVAIQTMFQFSYTTLFGAYTSYAYWQTKSLWAVTVSHSFCNYMGLPNLAFLNKASLLYDYRHVLMGVHVLGIGAFFQWFHVFTPSFS